MLEQSRSLYKQSCSKNNKDVGYTAVCVLICCRNLNLNHCCSYTTWDSRKKGQLLYMLCWYAVREPIWTERRRVYLGRDELYVPGQTEEEFTWVERRRVHQDRGEEFTWAERRRIYMKFVRRIYMDREEKNLLTKMRRINMDREENLCLPFIIAILWFCEEGYVFLSGFFFVNSISAVDFKASTLRPSEVPWEFTSSFDCGLILEWTRWNASMFLIEAHPVSQLHFMWSFVSVLLFFVMLYGSHLPRRLALNGMSKQMLPEGVDNEVALPWARHQLVVTKQKDNEQVSSSPYAMWDSFNPVTDFTKYYADNESIVDEVSRTINEI